MEIVRAILISLLLVLGQGWPAGLVNTAAANDQPCRHCHCGGTGCCVNDAPAAPPPTSPARPAPLGSHSEELSFLTVLLTLPLPPAISTGDLPGGARSLPPSSPGIPLHVRNCCFLI